MLLDYEFQEDEEATCVACVRPKDSSRDVFVTGSGTLLNGEIISKRGRLVIFRSTDDHAASFQQAAELSLAGAPYSVASLADGHVVAAVNASVHLHLLSVSDGSGELAISELAQWGGSFLAQSLAVRGQHILVGDALRSVTLLECVKQPSGTLTLNEVAREHSANGIMSVQFIDDDHYIAVDLNLNLFTMSKAPTGGPNAGKLQLEGLFHLGEMVTKIVPGRFFLP